MQRLIFFAISFLVLLNLTNGQDENEDAVKSRIYYGDFAKTGQFPYIGFLSYGHNVNSTFFIKCGGSIIHKRWALTAHHCRDRVYRNPVFTVGTIYERGNILLNQGQTRDVVRFYLHPLEWTSDLTNPKSWINTYASAYDFALMSFNESVVYNANVKPILLDWGHGFSYKDREGTFMGWGNTELPIWELLNPWIRYKVNETGLRSPILRYLKGKAIDPEQCHRKSNYSVTVQNGVHICMEASEERKTACLGDSGGPLVMTSDKGKEYQVGVLSYGTCGEYPTVFGNVRLVFEWIRQTMAHCGDDIFEEYGEDHPYMPPPIGVVTENCLIQTEREWEAQTDAAEWKRRQDYKELMERIQKEREDSERALEKLRLENEKRRRQENERFKIPARP